MDQNRSRKAEQQAAEHRLEQQAAAEAERFDYWRKPRPGGGTPNQPQYLADRGGDVAYRPTKKGMVSPSDSTRGHSRAQSTGAPAAAAAAHAASGSAGASRAPRHGNHSRAMSEAYAGTHTDAESGERGFFDYFFNPRPGGGTPVRGHKGEVVANLRTALAPGGAADAHGAASHEATPQGPSRPAPDVSAWPENSAVLAHHGTAGAPAAVAPLHSSPIQPSKPGATAGRRASPLRPEPDTRAELAQRTILALQGQLQEALEAERAREEELDATKAQLDMAVQLLEEYKQLYGPLPPKE